MANICETCDVYNCAWMKKMKPVDGWTAKPTKNGGYAIKACPLYKPIERKAQPEGAADEAAKRLSYALHVLRKERLAANGLCTSCGYPLDEAKYRTCSVCRAKKRITAKKEKVEKPKAEKQPRNRAYEYIKRKRLKDYRRANGLCPHCGKPATNGMKTCEECRERIRGYERRRGHHGQNGKADGNDN